MVNKINIGTNNISGVKIGSTNVSAVYIGDTMVYGGSSSRLPEGYTEVEYVQNTGSSTVNLGIQLMKNTSDSFSVVYENEMTWTSGGGNLQTFLTCAKETSPYPGWYERFDNSGNHVLGGYMMNFTTGRTNVSGSVYHVTVSCTQVSSRSHDYPLNLFSSLDSTKTPWRFCKGKLYNMKVTYNNVLVRDLVPCTNPSNVAGFYDLVNDVFYTSVSGYDALVAGPNV